MTTRFDYSRPFNIDEAKDLKTAIWFTIINYMHHQLGWNLDDCEQRLEDELRRKIPSGTFDKLQKVYGWNIKGSRLLDVGAGQGGAVLEALIRGANAFGIEPGEEFCTIGQMRLSDAEFEASRLELTGGEKLPFPDDYFDYVISLQVLEHVKDPLPILKEIYRVLKPGGECFISCENYLAFKEQHYRVPWLPLLPKWIGYHYLKMIGRDPDFLQNYVYYTTYPQIWYACFKIGFKNKTYERIIEHRMKEKNSAIVDKLIAQVIELPGTIGYHTIESILHLRYLFGVGVQVILKKDQNLKK